MKPVIFQAAPFPPAIYLSSRWVIRIDICAATVIGGLGQHAAELPNPLEQVVNFAKVKSFYAEGAS